MVMRSKILTITFALLLCASLFGQKTRAEFFKEFYGTLINSSGIEIPKYEPATPSVDLSDVIEQLESRYNIDIPAEEEAKFKTVEEVAEYVNEYLQQQATDIQTEDEPEVKPQKKKEKYSWSTKFYGSYGINEPDGLTGNSGWYGNLGKYNRDEGLNLFGNTYSWDVGIMWHQYGWTGKPKQSPNSFGFQFDYSAYDHWGADSVFTGFEDDTVATRWAISMVFQQDLTGRKKARPKIGFYIQESIRVGVHSYGHFDTDLWDVNDKNYTSIGLGLAEGFYFLIFDFKFYQNVAYSPAITKAYSELSLFDALDYEIGLRLGIALKF